MPKYMLLIHQDGKRWADADESVTGTIHLDYIEYTQQLIDAGAMVSGEPLQGADTAKIVSPGGVVTDGPFAETAEQLGGFYVVEAPDLDAMTGLCELLPAPYTLEIRPVVDMTGASDWLDATSS